MSDERLQRAIGACLDAYEAAVKAQQVNGSRDDMSDEMTDGQRASARNVRVPKIEVLYFEECPNYLAAVALVREVMASVGIVAPVELVAVETQEAAEREQVYGSPTVRVNGRDVAPPSDPQRRPALACRVYRAPDGHMTTLPSREAILAALEHF